MEEGNTLNEGKFDIIFLGKRVTNMISLYFYLKTSKPNLVLGNLLIEKEAMNKL